MLDVVPRLRKWNSEPALARRNALAIASYRAVLLRGVSLIFGLRVLAGTSMCRIGFLVLVTALTASTWSDSRAAGSFQTKPAFRTVVTAGVSAPATPSVSAPNVSADDVLGGCGRGRVRDPQTHVCRGPADIR